MSVPRSSPAAAARPVLNLALGASLCGFFGAGVARASTLDQEMRSAAHALSASLPTTADTVAVVDFTDLSGNATELGRFIAEELSVALVGVAKERRVIDRTHLKAILAEHKLSASGLMDPKTARRLGEIAGAQALVTGTLTPFGDSVRVTVKVLDTRTAQVLAASAFDFPRTKTIDELLERTAAEGGVAPSASLGASTPSRIEPRAAPPITQRAGGFLVALHGCRREGRSAACWGLVTNKNPTGAAFTLAEGRNWGTYAVDDTGTQDSGAQRIAIGTTHGGTAATLEPDLPIRFSAAFGGLSSEARSMTVVLAVPGHVLGRGFGPWDYEKLTFRNVSLEEAR